MIRRLNPVIRGWAAYYRTVVSKKAFVDLDTHMWKLAFSWAKRSHPNKSNRWVVDRHFGAFRKSRSDRWVFGDRDSGAYLAKFAWTPIVRHQVVKGPASPDDPALAEYWAERRRRRKPPLDNARLRLIQAQRGRCPLCRGLLLHADHEPQTPSEWEQWVKVTRTAIRRQAITVDAGLGTSDETEHSDSYTPTARDGSAIVTRMGKALLPAREPLGLLEPRCPENGLVRF